MKLNLDRCYKGLFDEEKEIITWYYDETAHEVANILKIMKKENRFIIEFSIQPYVGKYDEDVHIPNNTPVRFRNFGSRYSPFNLLFMKMYLNMNELDEFNSYYHQINIYEYLYNKENVLTKKFFKRTI